MLSRIAASLFRLFTGFGVSSRSPGVRPWRHGGLAAALAVLSFAAAHAEEFPVYPNAVYDAALSQQGLDAAGRSGFGGDIARSGSYVTADPFEAVLAFYRGVAREYAMPGRAPDHRLALPAEIAPGGSGATPPTIIVQQAFFILDGAPDLAHSTHWLMIARPIIGGTRIERDDQNGLRLRYGDIREATAITYLEIRRR